MISVVELNGDSIVLGSFLLWIAHLIVLDVVIYDALLSIVAC